MLPSYIANYALVRPLGSGVSGATWEAVHVTRQDTVALKIQDVDIDYPTNARERAVYPLLQGGVGMPRLWAAGVQGKYDYLAIDLLGSSLDGIYRKNGKAPFDLRTVCSIAVQLLTYCAPVKISRLEFMHSRGVLHRDVQLGNIVLGLAENDKILYMIDFGFSKMYIDHRTRKHIPNTRPEHFIGNYWFSSVNVHCRGKAASRRDDLEAAALLLVHLLTPNGLAWTRNGIPADEMAHNRLKRQKRLAQPDDLCRGLPQEFEIFLRYCRGLSFTANPDYAYCTSLFRDLGRELGFGNVEPFIWPPLIESKASDFQYHISATHPQRAPTSQRAQDAKQMEKVLHALAGLKLDNRPVLGDKKNIQGASPNVLNNSKALAKPLKKSAPLVNPTNLIVISDSSHASPAVRRQDKAIKLERLSKAVFQATDNQAVASLVYEFTALLKSNTSRTLTREGFAFLDALHKQLADPSVFIVPLRTSRSKTGRSKASAENEENTQPRPMGRERLNKLWQLRQGVGKARDNKTLAALLTEFGSLTDKTTGRNVTKDGFAFLEGMAERLKVV